MKRRSKLPLILLIGIIFLGIAYWYFKVYKDTDIKDNTPVEQNTDNSDEIYDCDHGYKCETIDGLEYKWSVKTKISVSNEYNYETDELEAGTLEINDGILEFIDLSGNVLKAYNEIEGKVIALEESIDLCDEKPIYVALTDNGDIYMSYAHNGILTSEAFDLIVNENKFVYFMTKVNTTDYVCTITEIYAKNEKGKIIKMVSNENVTEQ